MSNINKQALRIPERKKYNWGQAVMRDCDFCQQWALTVQHSEGGCICASCCDSEYTSDLKVTLAAALEQLEAAEKTSEARKQGLIRAHKMFQREKARAEAGEKRIEEVRGYNVDLAEESRQYQQQVDELNDALCQLLPGVQYMDPPYGGSVTPLEQVRRMVADYRERISDLERRHHIKPCPKCNDTGMADSGGTQPWGEPIEIECDCRQQDANTAELVAAGIITKVGE